MIMYNVHILLIYPTHSCLWFGVSMKIQTLLSLFALVLFGILLLPGAVHAEGSPVIHQVQPGETLADIATQYGVSESQLIALNNLRGNNRISPQQRLVIKPAQRDPDSDIYVVKRGDTLLRIARKFDTSMAAIQKANNLYGSVIYVGQRLKIPTKTKRTSPQKNKETIVHVVRRGETLNSIAQLYGVSIAQIKTLNGLKDGNLIRVGQKLIISGTAKPAKKKSARGPKKFVVDISQQRCWRYEGDVLLNTWRCSTGRNNSTKTGRFKVQSKIRKAYGSTWNIWMPWWLGIYWVGPVENGIHGQPWNAKTGARTWAGLVGTPITYGCVMLNDKAAETLWRWADIGTTVIIKR